MVEENVQRFAGFKVIDERADWNARATKDGRTAKNLRIGMHDFG